MTRHQTRRAVSVSASAYTRIAAHCATAGLPVSRFLEQVLAGDIADDPTPDPRQTVQEWADVSMIPVDSGTLSMLDDLVVRELELHGRRITAGHLLERAINRMLDSMGAP